MRDHARDKADDTGEGGAAPASMTDPDFGRGGRRGKAVLRFQLRYLAAWEPETLVSADLADALRQARSRATETGVTVSLWSNGRRIADCDPDPSTPAMGVDAEILERLIGAGVYLFGAPSQTSPEGRPPRDGA